MKKEEAIQKMNRLGKDKIPFVFLVDYEMQDILVFKEDETNNSLFYSIPNNTNCPIQTFPSTNFEWRVEPVPRKKYQIGFDLIKSHILNGDTYLLNFTQPSKIYTSLGLEEIFYRSNAAYKIHLKDKFVCFSPEIFVQIKDGKISSFPMKGTIDASVHNARVVLKNDQKELAEHNTIVDLIRNDLSIVADHVEVEKFMFIDRIKTNRHDLLQMSSQVSGCLPSNYRERIGSVLFSMLPAGSISGAPKPKTCEIIRNAENYKRGYYTGIFGAFDGNNVDSCVLIRFIEKQGENLVYKSGGGITFMSNCDAEYDELIKKVYVPIA